MAGPKTVTINFNNTFVDVRLKLLKLPGGCKLGSSYAKTSEEKMTVAPGKVIDFQLLSPEAKRNINVVREIMNSNGNILEGSICDLFNADWATVMGGIETMPKRDPYVLVNVEDIEPVGKVEFESGLEFHDEGTAVDVTGRFTLVNKNDNFSLFATGATMTMDSDDWESLINRILNTFTNTNLSDLNEVSIGAYAQFLSNDRFREEFIAELFDKIFEKGKGGQIVRVHEDKFELIIQFLYSAVFFLDNDNYPGKLSQVLDNIARQLALVMEMQRPQGSMEHKESKAESLQQLLESKCNEIDQALPPISRAQELKNSLEVHRTVTLLQAKGHEEKANGIKTFWQATLEQKAQEGNTPKVATATTLTQNVCAEARTLLETNNLQNYTQSCRQHFQAAAPVLKKSRNRLACAFDILIGLTGVGTIVQIVHRVKAGTWGVLSSSHTFKRAQELRRASIAVVAPG